MAQKVMLGSVAAQAVIAGCLDCGYCWDRGCSVCDPGYVFAHRLDTMRAVFLDIDT